VLRLVECSLLVPPRPGPDGRSRYAMLETLRGYGAGLLAGAGEQDQAQAALARYAVRVAEQAGAGILTTTGELAAARWLDAEDAMMGPVLAWAVEHDLAVAARLVTALGDWWELRGRLAGQEPLLRELAGRAGPGSDGWCAAQRWLAQSAFDAADLPQALQRCAAVIDVLGDREPSRALVDCLGLQSGILANLGRVPEAAAASRRAVAMARQLGYRSGQVRPTAGLVIGAIYDGDLDEAVQLARQGMQIPDIPGMDLRCHGYLLAEAGDLAAAEQACAATLARARDAGDMNVLGDLLRVMAELDLRAGRTGDAAAHLREAARLSLQSGDWFVILNVLGVAGTCARRPGGSPTRSPYGPPGIRSVSNADSRSATRTCGATKTPGATPGRRSARTGPARPNSAARR
jgi:tetratricopeptide (TPR) repeat protein